MKTRTKLVTAIALLCSGCAYQYGAVRIKPGETIKDAELVSLICARQADNHGGAAGAEWIPFAGYSVSKHIRREEFKNCVEAHGYVAIPPSD